MLTMKHFIKFSPTVQRLPLRGLCEFWNSAYTIQSLLLMHDFYGVHWILTFNNHHKVAYFPDLQSGCCVKSKPWKCHATEVQVSCSVAWFKKDVDLRVLERFLSAPGVMLMESSLAKSPKPHSAAACHLGGAQRSFIYINLSQCRAARAIS